MGEIIGRERTVREMLSEKKYSIDYYQRPYTWETKHVSELLSDLESRFNDSYEPTHTRLDTRRYGHYYLGAVITAERNNRLYIVDGQQRLTTLTLLLTFLHNLQRNRTDKVDVSSLVFSERYGERSFNLDIDERKNCMQALFNGQEYDTTGACESVRKLVSRYQDIAEEFSGELRTGALSYFIDWLLDRVVMVEISTSSEVDAYIVFETMNDRGLSLSATDMLRGYLLSEVSTEERAGATTIMDDQLHRLATLGHDEPAEFFKVFLRSKYAQTMRERTRGAQHQDFELIGTQFHRWVRSNADTIALSTRPDFMRFIGEDFKKLSEHYLKLKTAAFRPNEEFMTVYYNAVNKFTLQFPLILAPLLPTDNPDIARRKMLSVATWVDIYIARRVVNHRTLHSSSIVPYMFTLMKDIRNCDLDSLVELLKRRLNEMDEQFERFHEFKLHQLNRTHVHNFLARLTHHLDQKCDVVSSFEGYVERSSRNPYEIEHIIGDDYGRLGGGFTSEADFAYYRNLVGALVLLPRTINRSIQDNPFPQKLIAYGGENLLARSLCERCYDNNPRFEAYVEQSGHPFQHFSTFAADEIEARQELYRRLAEEIWAVERLDSVRTG